MSEREVAPDPFAAARAAARADGWELPWIDFGAPIPLGEGYTCRACGFDSLEHSPMMCITSEGVEPGSSGVVACARPSCTSNEEARG